MLSITNIYVALRTLPEMLHQEQLPTSHQHQWHSREPITQFQHHNRGVIKTCCMIYLKKKRKKEINIKWLGLTCVESMVLMYVERPYEKKQKKKQKILKNQCT